MGEVEEPFKIKIPQLQLHHTRRPRVDFVTSLRMRLNSLYVEDLQSG